MRDEDEKITEYKPRKIGAQGGSIRTTLPKRFLEEVAHELDINIIELIRDYQVKVEVYRGSDGSIMKGYTEIKMIRRGGEVGD